MLYAGTASGGVWRSTSGGTAWRPIFDKAPTLSVGSVAVAPHNPDMIWVGTGEGNPRNSQNFGVGIFRTIDGGKNWDCMGLENTHTIHRVIIHPTNPNIVWAAAVGSTNGPNEERGVFKTDNGGLTWRKVLYVNDLTGCADLVIDPNNPDKLIAAMWEYQRWPWFFKSGGKGSGLYVSHDGGETWEQRTAKDGLPKGELGRMGLAIAASNSDVVYALVEAKENALFKSTDGGFKWKKMATKSMGDRPFYYSDLFVDPQNENTIYSVHSIITKSIDGGKTFQSFAPYWRIHPDHHAFWINPNDPKHIIDGNDGGLNITYDGGQTWRYAENIPVGQFYHINIDNEIPYNVYGGLQDNGTVVGPSSIWKWGGMRNHEWQEVNFGDGFDAMPRKDDSRYCYAMSQGGELSYIDRETGDRRYIKPLHPDGKTDLRWNWNAALAQDPFKDQGLYFGSQFVHYSPDLGHSWELISPDLTTNDTSKLHQDISGGLTIDATRAENHCTILAISPSPHDKDVIWVGTDDGRLHITRDRGKSWTELTARLPDFPKGAWIPQIELSTHQSGEAFVVVNNYRQNDWKAYLYHTSDYGKSWKRLVSEDNARSFCLSVVQDLEEPDLVFLGTDQGLYYSLNHGSSWEHWPEGDLPNGVPVQDMKIHPRDGDLVLGTYGRGIWIMDNIEPLRELVREGKSLYDQKLVVFKPQTAILASYISYSGSHYPGDANYRGENKGTRGVIPVWVKPPVKKKKEAKEEKEESRTKKPKEKKQKEKKEKKGKEGEVAKKAKGPEGKGKRGGKGKRATVLVFNEAGDTIRHYTTEIDTGFTTVRWGLDTRGVAYPTNRKPRVKQPEPGGGPQVLPGTYRIQVHYKGAMDSTTLTVIDDPRIERSVEARKQEAKAIRDFYPTVEKAKAAYDMLGKMEKNIKRVKSTFSTVPDSLKKETLELGKAVQDSIKNYKEEFFTHETKKGIQRNPNTLSSKLRSAQTYIRQSEGAPNGSARIAIARANEATDELAAKINALAEGPYKEFREKASSIQFELFEELDKEE